MIKKYDTVEVELPDSRYAVQVGTKQRRETRPHAAHWAVAMTAPAISTARVMPGVDAYSVRHRPPPETSWWAEPMSREEWTARQQLERIRMNAAGSTLMPYCAEPK